ncbi:uncharacterized protein DUF4258 [Trinickia symbiotica]|uniref:23S rRNA pseudouridine(955/2504/2580) synthase RluC n=2 Tax=Trinickia symbiotica TaxID=863227 RepID=A0A2N7X3V3_9BURK|nr:23S rRNA pseudouridine(955/2504/2580) synthase RluC [Trinickia symbiotica]PPK44912.1 uncharacterized protein DUF4258 [Trinickia symbiotica]
MGMPSQVLPFKLNDANLRRLIHEVARDTARVFFVPHAKKRMRERKITPTQVYDCLRNGQVSERAHVNLHGSWQSRSPDDMPATRSQS